MKRKSILTIALIVIIIAIVVVAFVLLNKGENNTDIEGTTENEIIDDANESNNNEEVSKEEEKVETKTVTVEELMNYPESPEEDIDASIDSNGVVTIWGYKGKDSVVVIPKQIKGSSKLKISTVFSETSEMTALRIPGNAVFKYREGRHIAGEKLETVVIEEGVTEIKDYAFMDNSNLKNVVLPDSVQKIGATVFAMTSIEEIKIPEKVTKIDQYLFQDMKSKNLTVELGDNVTEIESTAFTDNKDLTVTFKIKEGTTTYNTVKNYIEYSREYKERYEYPEFKIEAK